MAEEVIPKSSWWKRRPRRQKIALISGGSGFAMVLLFLLIAPSIIASMIDSRIRAAVAESLGAETAIGDVDFSWSGRVLIRDLVVTPKGDAEPLARIPMLDIDVALWKAIGGSMDAEVKIDSPVITILQRPNGTFNYERPPQVPGKESPLRYKLMLTGGELRFRDAAGRTSVFRDLSVASDFDSDKKTGALDLRTGGLTVKGRWGDATTLVDIDVRGDELDLHGFEAISSAYGGPTRLAGTAIGGGRLATLARGELTFELKGVSLSGGPMGDEPLALEKSRVILDPGYADGRVDMTFRIDAGSAVAARGRVQGPPYETTISLRSDLSELSRQSPSILRLKSGVRLAGAVSVEASFVSGVDGVAMKIDGEITDLAASDDGKPVLIDNRLTIKLDAAWKSQAAAFEVTKAELRSQFATLDAKGGIAGLREGGKWTIQESSFRLHADLGLLCKKVKSFLDLPEDLTFGGTAHIDAKFDGTRLDSDARIQNFYVFGVGEAKDNYGPVDLTLVQKGALDDRGDFAIERWQVSAASLEIDIKGRVVALLEPSRHAKLTYAITLHPTAVGQQLAGLFGGIAPGGRDLVCVGSVEHTSARTSVGGQLQIDGLTLSAPLTAPTVIHAAPVFFSLAMEGDRTHAAVRAASLSFEGGAWDGLAQRKLKFEYGDAIRLESEDGWIELKKNALQARFDLALLVRDLRPLLGVPKDYSAKGSLEADATLRYEGDYLHSVGTTKIAGLELAGLSEPRLELTHDFSMDRRRMILLVRRVGIESTFVRGGVSGTIRDYDRRPEFVDVRGGFTYVPDKLDAALRPWLPGRLSGAGEEKLEITLDGRAADFGLLPLLRGTKGTAALGLGTFTWTGVSVSGVPGLEWQRGRLVTRPRLNVNGGPAEIDLAVEPDVRSELTMSVHDARANAEMGPLLSKINPLFFTINGSVDGRLKTGVSLAWEGPIDPNEEWLAGARKKLRGEITFSMKGVRITASPTLGAILKLLGEERASLEGDIPETRLSCRDGKIHCNGLVLRVRTYDLKFTGWIALDETMDLKVEVPVSESLARKYRIEKYAGKTFTVPLTGTVRAPKIDAEKAIQELVKKAAAGFLEDRLKDFFDKR